jgi:hypothetical protein
MTVSKRDPVWVLYVGLVVMFAGVTALLILGPR